MTASNMRFSFGAAVQEPSYDAYAEMEAALAELEAAAGIGNYQHYELSDTSTRSIAAGATVPMFTSDPTIVTPSADAMVVLQYRFELACPSGVTVNVRPTTLPAAWGNSAAVLDNFQSTAIMPFTLVASTGARETNVVNVASALSYASPYIYLPTAQASGPLGLRIGNAGASPVQVRAAWGSVDVL